ncbi:triose-phosphate isomerase [Anaerospora sp.]|jgi:triosephosphate isomerase|uniref:triose-phosphate isomerase n=1 Tax=Anaerospora sp. TaxID=1960278 RepID=UPI00289A357B|nr:triose-phosphate isomerase [Anaerospora sp.]MDF2929247.1 tpiA [Anaerospora sp.]
MRKPIIAGNWKMHKTVGEALALVRELCGITASVTDVEIVICPTFTALYPVHMAICEGPLRLGAQNMHWEAQGAYTGEISPAMVKEVGCTYVIIGHSERRQYFGETDDTVNKKVKAAIAAELIPIMCVGETLEQREAGITEGVVGRQVRQGLTGLTAEQIAEMVIAYEPVWAIGTGRTASSEDANAVCRYIRQVVTELAGTDSAEKVRIQYGGSVKGENIAELMAKSDIDGALVGGASLDAESFAKIIKFK